MSGMAEVLAAHWSKSTFSDSDPCVDKCDGCGAVIYTWGNDLTPDGIEPLATHQEAMLAAVGFGPVREAWDEGYATGNAHNGRRDANPYRAAAVRGEG